MFNEYRNAYATFLEARNALAGTPRLLGVREWDRLLRGGERDDKGMAAILSDYMSEGLGLPDDVRDRIVREVTEQATARQYGRASVLLSAVLDNPVGHRVFAAFLAVARTQTVATVARFRAA